MFLSIGGAFLFLTGLWFWLGLLVALLLLWVIFRRRKSRPIEYGEPRMILPEEQPEIIKQIMRVRIATEEDGVQVYRGPLLEAPSAAFEKLKSGFAGAAWPLLQQDARLGSAIVLMPKPAGAEKPIRPWVHWMLFALTILTTTWAGATHQQINLFAEPQRLLAVLPYSLGLLAILGFHELGHYFTARRHTMKVTPPFFIPVPFALGTFGAFIQMRSPPESRRVLFDVAIAGPLAGLVIAIPLLYFGLQQSVVEAPPGPGASIPFFLGASPNSSVLLGLTALFAIDLDLAAGHLLRLSPLAFAGWLGLLVTALNLLPIGQLDGGHIARGMLGTQVGFAIGQMAMLALFLLAVFVWTWLLFWVIIVFFIAGRGTPPLNDLTPVSKPRLVLGVAAFLILALIVAPLPPELWAAWQGSDGVAP